VKNLKKFFFYKAGFINGPAFSIKYQHIVHGPLKSSGNIIVQVTLALFKITDTVNIYVELTDL
jgi:hypothetical protein